MSSKSSNTDGQVAILRVTLPSRLVYFEDGKKPDGQPNIIEATLPARVFYMEPPPSRATVSKRVAGLAVEGGAITPGETGQPVQANREPKLPKVMRSLTDHRRWHRSVTV